MTKESDRELLELAAKAIKFGSPDGRFCWTESEYPRGSGKDGALWNYYGHGETAELWNPLTDDGDAFRLALKARITLRFEDNAPPELRLPRRCAVAIFENGKYIAESVINDDEAGAMRMVLVRAAATIGKGMP